MSAAGPHKELFKDKGGSKMDTRKVLVKFVLVLGLTALPFFSVYAADYDIKEMTPEIKAALEARRGRFEKLSALKAEGKIGENNRGYVEALAAGGDADEVVRAENSDRSTIYNAIIEQNALSGDGRSLVEKVFAQVQRDKAAPGDSIQDESGQWIKK